MKMAALGGHRFIKTAVCLLDIVLGKATCYNCFLLNTTIDIINNATDITTETISGIMK